MATTRIPLSLFKSIKAATEKTINKIISKGQAKNHIISTAIKINTSKEWAMEIKDIVRVIIKSQIIIAI